MIEQLIDRNYSIFINLTGGCSEIIYEIINTSGSSKLFIGSQIPYSSKYTNDILGYELEKYVTEQTAIDLANDAYIKAFKYSPIGKINIGIGITASLKVDNQRDGRINQVIYCIRFKNRLYVGKILLDSTLNRSLQSNIAVTKILNELLNPPITFLSRPIYDYNLLGLWERDALEADIGPVFDPNKMFIYPISGNPLHDRHLEILKWMEKCLNKKGYFQVSTIHPLKGNVDPAIICTLLQDVYQHAPILVDFNNSLYVDKYNKYECPIIMGDDAFMNYKKWVYKTYGETQNPIPRNMLYVIPRKYSIETIISNEGTPMIMPLSSRSSTELRNG